jgi:hypothetical protein
VIFRGRGNINTKGVSAFGLTGDDSGVARPQRHAVAPAASPRPAILPKGGRRLRTCERANLDKWFFGKKLL